MNFGYEYFSGANLYIEIAGMAALECAGLSFGISESKRPIYGYSSRFFDAVARGQVLVQGSFIVNYVHEDYVREILTGVATVPQDGSAADIKSRQVVNDFGVPATNTDLLEDIAKNWAVEQQMTNALRDLYWPKPAGSRARFNPHDIFGGFNIKAHFGEMKTENGFGLTGFMLEGVYIVGRGKQLQISEDVVVEEYNFFARNSVPMYPEYEILTVAPDSRNPATTETPEAPKQDGVPPNQDAYDKYGRDWTATNGADLAPELHDTIIRTPSNTKPTLNDAYPNLVKNMQRLTGAQ